MIHANIKLLFAMSGSAVEAEPKIILSVLIGALAFPAIAR